MRTTLKITGAIVAWAAACAPALAQDKAPIGPKLQPYIECINRLSERSMQSQARYLSWAKPSGPTGKERIVYGAYTIYDTAPCRKGVETAAKMAPSDPVLERAGADYAAAVGALEPLLKEADDYYTQGNYKDDRMAGGKALHPRLMAAWAAFVSGDRALRDRVQYLNDQAQLEQLADVEKREGRKARYLIMDLMIKAKAVTRSEDVDPKTMDLAKATQAIAAFDGAVKALEQYATEHPDDRVGSTFVSAAKSFLTTSKDLMRRVRDRTPYSSGERMMLNQQGAGWMVEGSPARLTRDYNQLVDRYNSGAKF